MVNCFAGYGTDYGPGSSTDRQTGMVGLRFGGPTDRGPTDRGQKDPARHPGAVRVSAKDGQTERRPHSSERISWRYSPDRLPIHRVCFRFRHVTRPTLTPRRSNLNQPLLILPLSGIVDAVHVGGGRVQAGVSLQQFEDGRSELRVGEHLYHVVFKAVGVDVGKVAVFVGRAVPVLVLVPEDVVYGLAVVAVVRLDVAADQPVRPLGRETCAKYYDNTCMDRCPRIN